MGNYISMDEKITPLTFLNQLNSFIKSTDICLHEITFNDVEYENDCAYDLFHMHGLAIFCYGANKGVFIPHKLCDFVFKFDFDNLEENYCDRETCVYQNAECENLEQYFAKTEFYGYLAKTPIYIQQYVERECEFDGECSVEEINTVRNIRNKTPYDTSEMPGRWIADFINCYGEDELLKLFVFLEEEGINDLHARNLGYIKDKPVLFDYSGYYESSF